MAFLKDTEDNLSVIFDFKVLSSQKSLKIAFLPVIFDSRAVKKNTMNT